MNPSSIPPKKVQKEELAWFNQIVECLILPAYFKF